MWLKELVKQVTSCTYDQLTFYDIYMYMCVCIFLWLQRQLVEQKQRQKRSMPGMVQANDQPRPTSARRGKSAGSTRDETKPLMQYNNSSNPSLHGKDIKTRPNMFMWQTLAAKYAAGAMHICSVVYFPLPESVQYVFCPAISQSC